MKIIKHFILNILISSLLLYGIANYLPELGLKITSEYKNIKDIYIIYGILGIFFWFIISFLRKIIQILALPAKYLTLGISSLIINVIMFYVFEQFINYLNIGIQIHLESLIKTTILSVIITGVYFIIKKINI